MNTTASIRQLSDKMKQWFIIEAEKEHKEATALNMIRLFSKMLRIPADALMKEYKLHP